MLITSAADIGIITTIDNRMTFPVSLDFEAGYTYDDLKDKVIKHVMGPTNVLCLHL